jgi:hypothetical protein
MLAQAIEIQKYRHVLVKMADSKHYLLDINATCNT